MFFRTFILLFTLPIVAQADVDFSNYDVPLYTQIVDRIKAKVSARLGEGSNTRERYFIIPFAYEDRGNHPEYSHSFISVIRVLADNKQPKLTPGLKLRRYRNRELLSIAPTIVFIEKTKSLSVAFMPWPVWTSFSPTADFSGRDLKCGASMERQEC